MKSRPVPERILPRITVKRYPPSGDAWPTILAYIIGQAIFRRTAVPMVPKERNGWS